MPVLVQSEIQRLALTRVQGNVAVDPPFDATEIQDLINEAYSDIWRASGGGTTNTLSSVAWTSVPSAGGNGSFLGSLFDIEEILHLWALVTDDNGGRPGDLELDRVDHSRIMSLRSRSVGTYTTPKVYSVAKQKAANDAQVHRYRLEVFPAINGYHFPIQYIQQFTPLNGTTIVTPDVNDVESRDIALWTAAKMAPLCDRSEFLESIVMDISERTQLLLERKISALLEAAQDR